MTNVRVKFIIAGTILAIAIGYLGYAGISAGRSYYLSVDS